MQIFLHVIFEGNANFRDDSKAYKQGKVVTSWNSKYTYPTNGYYELELGSNACGSKMTLFYDGKTVGRYRLANSGNLRINVIHK